MNKLIKDLENHEKELNKKEIKVIAEIIDDLRQMECTLRDMKKVVEALQQYNFYELVKDMPKEEELEMIKSLFDKYTALTQNLTNIAKKILELKYYVDEEII